MEFVVDGPQYQFNIARSGLKMISKTDDQERSLIAPSMDYCTNSILNGTLNSSQ